MSGAIPVPQGDVWAGKYDTIRGDLPPNEDCVGSPIMPRTPVSSHGWRTKCATDLSRVKSEFCNPMHMKTSPFRHFPLELILILVYDCMNGVLKVFHSLHQLRLR